MIYYIILTSINNYTLIRCNICIMKSLYWVNKTSFKDLSEGVVRRCSVKKVFLEISQKFTVKHLCQSLFLCFPVNFTKFLRTPFLTEHLRWLLLIYSITFGTPFQHTNKVLSFRVKYKGFNASFAYYSV